ncbi:MAG: hypothetical protein GY928_12260 [Colwellia sp.]|nr:hypothetical protein [Colwellia sp.]
MQLYKLSLKDFFVFKIFPFFLLFFFVGFAYGNSVEISSPENGDKVGSRVTVKGTYDIEDDSHVWVLTHPKLLQDQWWPQPKPVLDEKNNWQAFAYIGEPQDIGIEFEIAVATFDKEAETEILKYHEHGKNTSQWIPISFPKVTSQIDMITVKKESH